MHDELTKTDIEKMQAELDDRLYNQRPVIIEEVKRTRAFGDLSENAEYKMAKEAQRKNDGRIRYLQNMIKTATVIEDTSSAEQVGLFDYVTLWVEEDEEEMTVRVCTTIRTAPEKGLVSKESPLGRAILGKTAGDRATVVVNDAYSYDVIIRKIEKSEDDGSAPIMSY